MEKLSASQSAGIAFRRAIRLAFQNVFHSCPYKLLPMRRVVVTVGCSGQGGGSRDFDRFPNRRGVETSVAIRLLAACRFGNLRHGRLGGLPLLPRCAVAYAAPVSVRFLPVTAWAGECIRSGQSRLNL